MTDVIDECCIKVTYKVRVKVPRNTGRRTAAKEIDRPSLSGTALLPADASCYSKLFDICFYTWSSLFVRLSGVPIAFPASGDATFALWFRFVAFHMSYPDMVRQRVSVIEWLSKVHVLASDTSGPDFWSAYAAPPDSGRSIVALNLVWR